MNTAILEQEILNGFPDPVIMLNTRREIVGRNTAAREFLGTGPMGRDLSLSLRHPAILAAADAVLAGKKPAPAQVSIPLSVPREFTLHVSPLSADGGGDGGAMLVFHDVTAAKTAEKMRADFVANVSHELRSPLASLVGFIETLRGPAKGDEEARERFLGIMENEAGRMTRLIDDLLSLSRVEAGEFIRPEGTIDLKTLLKVISDSLSVRAEERKMSIRL
ncbi:MAG: PAS domain-containing protein, partial [Rhodospirillales bacterium]|nr:PAS domain-containing protein [Rhodospirillales bacterium]